jgi:hypothetical protein
LLSTGDIISLAAQAPALLQAFTGFGGGEQPQVGLPNDPLTQQLITNLNEILASQGQTDREALNRDIATQQARTQGTVDSIQGALARAGLQGSGAGQAVSAAAEVGGLNTIAQIEAEERRLADQRMRNDIGLAIAFEQLIRDFQALQTGQFNQQQARSDQIDAAQLGALAQLGSAIASIFA